MEARRRVASDDRQVFSNPELEAIRVDLMEGKLVREMREVMERGRVLEGYRAIYRFTFDVSS